jgi:uncharacterized membrane protein
MTNAERWAARVLQVGGLTAVALIAVGLLGAAAWHERSGATIASIAQIRAALSQRPIDFNGITAMGFLALCVTPFLAVVSAGVAFLLDGDRRFTIISAVVAGALLLGLWLGGA